MKLFRYFENTFIVMLSLNLYYSFNFHLRNRKYLETDTEEPEGSESNVDGDGSIDESVRSPSGDSGNFNQDKSKSINIHLHACNLTANFLLQHLNGLMKLFFCFLTNIKSDKLISVVEKFLKKNCGWTLVLN